MEQCIYCKSTDLKKDLLVTTQARAEGIARPTVGVIYTKEKKDFFGIQEIGIEPIFTEICNECGGVRLYVKNVKRNWELYSEKR
jgi:hypothetical protein